ncbi:calponin homology domain-containing protein DDB_G0272472-like [Dreissena polymorpha]|uniref:Uncharacterized protein n=1 Tax=Dreissena polymorpha TaxID=45954 RepID=A0A9D4N350_DREPO|nr:calponin homology domain-containing protein DDB_G0272472-like [Dreissena polymorpha]KAH3888245.1 hypothetical protein DPMN_012277 [Dreissena polymorpha]
MSIPCKLGHSVGSQAGMVNMRMIGQYIVDLLEKCYEIQSAYRTCQEDLKQGRELQAQSERSMDALGSTVEKFRCAMDRMGVSMLQDNVTLAKMHLQIDTLRREIAEKKLRLEWRALEVPKYQDTGERIRDLRKGRERLELQLTRVNNDVDTQYEELFDAQERLSALKAQREANQMGRERHLTELKEQTRNLDAQKKAILSVDSGSLNMSELYVNPADARRIETELENLRHQQVLASRHIQQQTEDRIFLRETAAQIRQRVAALEAQVRKESGDHRLLSVLTREPNWYPDMTSPSLWYSSPPLSLEQLRWMRDRQHRTSVPVPETVKIDDIGASTSYISNSLVIDISKDSSSVV